MVELNRCPEEFNVCVSRDDDKAIGLTVNNPDGTPADISLSSFLLTVNRLEEPPDVSTQVFQVVGVVASPVVSFPFGPTDLDNLEDAFCDVEETDSGGKKLTISKGTFVIQQDITK